MTGCVRGFFGGGAAREALADDGQSVLGGEEQHATATGDGEATQAGGSGGDGNGQVEREEGFAALGLAADDADGLSAPEAFDEPALLGGDEGDLVGVTDRQCSHRRFLLGEVGGGVMEQTSKKSFSSICRASRATAAWSSSWPRSIMERRLPAECSARAVRAPGESS